jgi:hypothetical protein
MNMQLNQEDNLLIQSYLTSAFLLNLKQNDFLNSDYYKNRRIKDVTVDEYLPKINIDNQGALLMILYSMLVIPKQLLFNSFKNDFEKLNIKIKEIVLNVESSYKNDKPEIDFIRHIRNSVAHANVTFSQKESVTFSDRNRDEEKCSIIIPLIKMPFLLKELQQIFINYINSKKNDL